VLHCNDIPVKVSRAMVEAQRLSLRGGAARAGDAQGTPTQSHIAPSKVVYEE